MGMTRQDYELLADRIAGTRYIATTTKEAKIIGMALDVLTVTLADDLSAKSSAFDRNRFLSACQYLKLPRLAELVLAGIDPLADTYPRLVDQELPL